MQNTACVSTIINGYNIEVGMCEKNSTIDAQHWHFFPDTSKSRDLSHN